MQTHGRPVPRGLSAVTALAAIAMVLVGCGKDDTGPRVLRVGEDHQTIQAAVDAARPGDLVLIPAGTYDEEVEVTTPRLVIRGTDRNRVILDGDNTKLDGFRVTADQVAIENLTVRRFAQNGIIFAGPYNAASSQAGPVGWRVSYVTAANNGNYGLYAFGTGAGQFDHNYASGQPDSGIYVGQCRRCGAVVMSNVLERNAVGYENTNASGVVVAANVIRHNRVGMTVNSATTEQLAPQKGSLIVANLVIDNDDPQTPETPRGGFGVGIAVAGGTANQIERNVVSGHPGAGIVVTDQERYLPSGNKVRRNRLSDNALDLAFAPSDASSLEPLSNCFAANEGVRRTLPADLLATLGCDAAKPTDAVTEPLALPKAPKGIEFSKVSPPGRQPNMPGATNSRWKAPGRTVRTLDPSKITVPSA